MSLAAPSLYHEVLRYGIAYVVGPVVSEAEHNHLLPWQLLVALTHCEEAYLHHTVIALLLLHPDWAESVEQALQRSPATVADDLEVLVLATCYLQQRWYLHLGLALGEVPHFPAQQFARLWERRGLPAPERAFGESGLCALEIAERRRNDTNFAYRDAWDAPVHHLLWQERHRRDHLLTVETIPVITLVPPNGLPDKIAAVDRDHIARFVTQVAEHISAPDHLYLGSESTAVLCGLHRATEAIDVHIGEGEVLSPALETALRALRPRPETVWVADTTVSTLPLPSQWRAQVHPLCAIGNLEVAGLNWASVAVAKIALGTSWHLADVQAFLDQGWVTWEAIEQMVADVLPRLRMATTYRSLDGAVFQQMVQATATLSAQATVGPVHSAD